MPTSMDLKALLETGGVGGYENTGAFAGANINSMLDLREKARRAARVEELINAAKANQDIELQDQLKSSESLRQYRDAQIEQMRNGHLKENGTQKANLMKEQALEKARRAAGILSGIRSSYDLPGMDSSPALDSFVNDKEIPEEAKRFLRPDPKTSNYTKQAIDAAIGHLNGYDPLQMKQLGIQTRESNANLRNENNLDSAEFRKQLELEQRAKQGANKTKVDEAGVLRELEAKIANNTITDNEQMLYDLIKKRRLDEKAASAMANPNQTRPLIDPSSIGIKTTTPLQERTKIEGKAKPSAADF